MVFKKPSNDTEKLYAGMARRYGEQKRYCQCKILLNLVIPRVIMKKTIECFNKASVRYKCISTVSNSST
jgi:hypothetical protein